MNAIVYGLLLPGLFGTLSASSFPIDGPEMYNSRAHNHLEKIVNEFLEQIDDESSFRREKKYQPETQPLLGHRRKSDPTQLSCQSHMSLFESNRMIDTKTSVNNGAKFLSVDKIEPGSQFSLKELQDSCVKMCCSTDFCDTAMLSLVHGQNGYRCYMFKCSQHCLFIKHKDYALLRQKSPEQEFDEKNIQTGHRDNMGAKSMKDMNVAWKENDERHVKFGEESKIKVSKSDSVQAVIILVVGCLLVVSFFVYIALSTKYLSKKLRIMNLLGTDRTKSSAQNVDADGDYLINGLYL